MVACDIKTELVAVMVKARDRYPCDDPAARLAAWATMFRCWALVNRAEFQMALANPTLAAASLSSRRDGLGSLPEVNEDGSLNPFAAYFAQLFIQFAFARPDRRAETGGLGSGSARPHPRECQEACRLLRRRARRGGASARGGLFKLAWARLYGIVMIEVFGQVECQLIASDSVFNTLIRETFASLGLAENWDRLLQVSRDTALCARESEPTDADPATGNRWRGQVLGHPTEVSVGLANSTSSWVLLVPEEQSVTCEASKRNVTRPDEDRRRRPRKACDGDSIACVCRSAVRTASPRR